MDIIIWNSVFIEVINKIWFVALMMVYETVVNL